MPSSEAISAAVRALTDMCPSAHRATLEAMLSDWTNARQRIDFDRFEALKPFFRDSVSGELFRVRQIAYFSMGGIAHDNCATNLANVFATGAFSLTVMRSPTRSAMPSTGAESVSFMRVSILKR